MQTTERRLEKPAGNSAAQPFTKSVDASRRSAGVRDLLGGLGLIAVGLLMGGSVFTGNPDTLDWIFDGLGTFWACKGLYRIFTA